MFIIIGASVVYGWNLTKVSLVYWDEGYWTNDARWILGDRSVFFCNADGPVYPALVAVAFFFFGIKDYVAAAVSA